MRLLILSGKYQCDPAVELVGLDESYVNLSDNATRVNENRGGLPNDPVRTPHAAPLVENNGEGHWKGANEILDVIRASLLIPAIYCDHPETGLRMCSVHPNQFGKFLAARRAPRPPERNDNGTTPKLGQLEAATRQEWKIDLRCGLAGLLGMGIPTGTSQQQDCSRD